jgi:hypothetical protein
MVIMETILPPTPEAVAPLSLANPLALQAILQQADAELAQLDPQVLAMETQLADIQAKLTQLKQNKRKLVTLRLSLQALLAPEVASSPPITPEQPLAPDLLPKALVSKLHPLVASAPQAKQGVQASYSKQTFLPDQAFQQADTLLKQKQSLNYDLFRAIVFNGGIANTEQIKEYLITQGIQQPNSGGSFASVDRSEISARVGYLIRKGLVEAMGKGQFIAKLGWGNNEAIS